MTNTAKPSHLRKYFHFICIFVNLYKLVYLLTSYSFYLMLVLKDLGGQKVEENQHFSVAFQGFLVVSVSSGEKHILHPCREKPRVFIVYKHSTSQNKFAELIKH